MYQGTYSYWKEVAFSPVFGIKHMEKLTLRIKNMVCPSCITVLKHELGKIGVQTEGMSLGEATILMPEELGLDTIEEVLDAHGFAIIQDDERQVVEDIKLAVRELIQRQAVLKDTIRNSDFIAERVGKSYWTLSEIFSNQEGMTIEKYIIQQKIKRTKELLHEGELSLSEIATHLGYSSVQHLSCQFKKVEGVSVSDFKKQLPQ